MEWTVQHGDYTICENYKRIDLKSSHYKKKIFTPCVVMDANKTYHSDQFAVYIFNTVLVLSIYKLTYTYT